MFCDALRGPQVMQRGSEPDATQFCIGQYNRVLARLAELEPALKPLFAPLSESVSPEVVRIAARELLAYFEVEASEFHWAFGRPFFYSCRPRRTRVKCVPISVTCD
ncbi:MAG: hypothetical protein ACRD8U_14655 [Pyrinomonadaceae bacterium]